jgi:hypothetical protein
MWPAQVEKLAQGAPTPVWLAVVWQVPAMHVPWLQTFEAQQGWLSAPHAVQLFDWQTVCPRHAGAVAQQVWPALPHAAAGWQLPLVQVFPAWQVLLSQHTNPATPQQKPRESQVGAVPHMVLEVQPGKQTGTPEVPAFASQTYEVRQPPGDWPGMVHCLRQTLAGPTPEGLRPHWLPATQSTEVAQPLVQ